MSEDSGYIDGVEVAGFKVTSQRVQPLIQPHTWTDLSQLSFVYEVTATVDTEMLPVLPPESKFVTVEYSTDHNPWHRTATTFRQRLHRARDCAWWTFRKRVLRRKLIETTKITIPNCRLTVRTHKKEDLDE